VPFVDTVLNGLEIRLEPGGEPLELLASLLDLCRREQIPTAMVMMPEGRTYRDWYGPGKLQQFRVMLDGLSHRFGIPVIEAMAAGTPVISSNCSALPEVVGEAGVLVDPEDTNAVVEAIRWFSNEPAARAEYIARGVARAEGYRWEQCVERLVKALETCP